MLIIEHNIDTNERIEREMTAEEIKQYEADLARYNSQKQLKAQIAAQKNALLEKLGITEEEARLLFGGN